MQQFIISYTFTEGSEEEWHATIAKFIQNLETHPELKGRISYRCLKAKGGLDYYHLATVADEEVGKILGAQDFFKSYTAETERVGGGSVRVTPLELVAETAPLGV